MCHHHNIRKLITVRQLGADVFDHQKSFSDFLITLQKGQHALRAKIQQSLEKEATNAKNLRCSQAAFITFQDWKLQQEHRRLSIILKIRHYEKSEKEDIVAAIEHNAPEHSSYT